MNKLLCMLGVNQFQFSRYIFVVETVVNNFLIVIEIVVQGGFFLNFMHFFSIHYETFLVQKLKKYCWRL